MRVRPPCEDRAYRIALVFQSGLTGKVISMRHGEG